MVLLFHCFPLKGPNWDSCWRNQNSNFSYPLVSIPKWASPIQWRVLPFYVHDALQHLAKALTKRCAKTLMVHIAHIITSLLLWSTMPSCPPQSYHQLMSWKGSGLSWDWAGAAGQVVSPRKDQRLQDALWLLTSCHHKHLVWLVSYYNQGGLSWREREIRAWLQAIHDCPFYLWMYQPQCRRWGQDLQIWTQLLWAPCHWVWMDQIINLKMMLQYLSVPLQERSYIYRDNKMVIDSSTIPHAKLHKRHNTLCLFPQCSWSWCLWHDCHASHSWRVLSSRHPEQVLGLPTDLAITPAHLVLPGRYSYSLCWQQCQGLTVFLHY